MKTKPNETKHAVRQGDVYLESINTVPDSAMLQKPKNGKVILAYGEVTNHDHSIPAEDVANWWKSTGEYEQFVELKTETDLSHQEHGAIKLTSKKYGVIPQMQYTPKAVIRDRD